MVIYVPYYDVTGWNVRPVYTEATYPDGTAAFRVLHSAGYGYCIIYRGTCYSDLAFADAANAWKYVDDKIIIDRLDLSQFIGGKK